MSDLYRLKGRLKNTANVEKIARTMELVAATKMRRAQEIALASRPYALAVLDLFARLSASSRELPPIMQLRPVKRTLFLLVTSDKGLAGAFNSALLKTFERYATEHHIAPDDRFVAVGEKAAAYARRKNYPLAKQFAGTAEFVSPEQTRPLSDFLIQGYLEGGWDQINLFSMHFRSALRQEPFVRELLPIEFESIKAAIQAIIPET